MVVKSARQISGAVQPAGWPLGIFKALPVPREGRITAHQDSGPGSASRLFIPCSSDDRHLLTDRQISLLGHSVAAGATSTRRWAASSLSDVISFGVAPAALAYAAGLNGGWDAVALIYFVCCGVSRLARFNVTAETLAAGSGSGKVAYFEGTPIPTSMVLTAVLAFAAWQERIGEHLYGGAWDLGPWEFHPLSLLFIASGSMMISKTLRIPKP